MPEIDQILETSLYVRDIEEATVFYSALLNIEPYSKEPGRHVFFKIGATMLLLFQPENTRTEGIIPAHGSSGQGHAAFAVDHADLPFWRKHLQSQGIEIEMEYGWPSGGRSIYFRDPSGNSIEFVTPDTWP